MLWFVVGGGCFGCFCGLCLRLSQLNTRSWWSWNVEDFRVHGQEMKNVASAHGDLVVVICEPHVICSTLLCWCYFGCE